MLEKNKSQVVDARKNENPQKRFWIVKAVNSKSLKTEGAN